MRRCKFRLPYRSDVVLALLLLVQVLFWYGIPYTVIRDESQHYWVWEGTKTIIPEMTVVDDVPGETAMKALAFGDEEFLFRVLALQVQDTGDTFGRFTPLKNYDYAKVAQWFFLLDTLDADSHFVPALASYIYGQTPKTQDLVYIIDYLEKHSQRDIEHNWWWMSQAVYLANHRLGDKQWALRLAYKLAKTPDSAKAPIWVKQMPAFIHEKLGEKEAALAIIYGIAQNVKDLPPGEINYMNYFIQQRLGLVHESIEKMKKIQEQDEEQSGNGPSK